MTAEPEGPRAFLPPGVSPSALEAVVANNRRLLGLPAQPATGPAAAALEVHARVFDARQVLIEYEYAANLYLRMKTASISWSTHADKLATRLRSLLKAIEECERVVREETP